MLHEHTEILSYAFLNGDQQTVWEFIAAEFNVYLQANQLRQIMLQAGKRWKREKDWSDATWRSWIKNRLGEFEVFPVGESSTPDDLVSARMHIFFICIEETEEMLTRLRTARLDAATLAAVSRSKMFKDDSRIPVPIDATAAKL